MFIRAAALAVVVAAAPATLLAQSSAPLTKVDQAAGWKVLFDGSGSSAWRGYKQTGFPEKGWKVVDGTLHRGGGGGDIVTTDEYGDFELVFEFKAGPKANSGVIYHCTEAAADTWQTGAEFQILDDTGSGTKPTDMHSAGALYDLQAPPENKVFKGGDWNTGRIYWRNGQVQHWLNGVKVAEVDVNSQTWKDTIAKSKFKDYKGFGIQPKGRIALQDHPGEVWFRNIKIRDLGAPLAKEKVLFNAKDMTGWKAHLNDNAKMENVWSVKDGVLVCSGTPAGYIYTDADYTNFVLKVEWRWDPATKKAGNSGVLFRMHGDHTVWPRSLEAQLMSGNAGDFYTIGGFPMKGDAARTNGRNIKKTHAAERPIGEWNEYEIIADKGTITLKVNGEELNRGTDAQEIAGKICLQSEGAPIHFKSVRLAPLD